MEFVVDTGSREPIYRQLAIQIREGVARGRLTPGDKLPSARELSLRRCFFERKVRMTSRSLIFFGLLRRVLVTVSSSAMVKSPASVSTSRQVRTNTGSAPVAIAISLSVGGFSPLLKAAPMT